MDGIWYDRWHLKVPILQTYVLDEYVCEPATPRHTQVSTSSKEKIGLGQQVQVTW